MLDVVLPVVQVILSAILIVLVLMHSGRDTGFGGMGFTPASQGGQHIVERNLTRLTLVVAALFGFNTIALFYVLSTEPIWSVVRRWAKPGFARRKPPPPRAAQPPAIAATRRISSLPVRRVSMPSCSRTSTPST